MQTDRLRLYTGVLFKDWQTEGESVNSISQKRRQPLFLVENSSTYPNKARLSQLRNWAQMYNLRSSLFHAGMDPAMEPGAGGDSGVSSEATFNQNHEEIVPARTWWWAVQLSLSAVALVANLIFIVTVIYNR